METGKIYTLNKFFLILGIIMIVSGLFTKHVSTDTALQALGITTKNINGIIKFIISTKFYLIFSGFYISLISVLSLINFISERQFLLFLYLILFLTCVILFLIYKIYKK